MNQLLGEIFEEESIADHPALIAIVTNKHGGAPGRRSCVQAQELGYDVNNEDGFWSEQVKLVFEYHQRQRGYGAAVSGASSG